MRRPGPRRASRRAAAWLGLGGCLIAGLVGAAVGAAAQEPAAAPAPAADAPAAPKAAAAPSVIPASQVALRAAELSELLRGIRERAAPTPAVAQVERRLEGAEASWKTLAAAAVAQLQQPRGGSIAEIDTSWSDREHLATGWSDLLATRIQQVAADLELLDEREDLWQRTLESARRQALPREVVSDIRASLASLAEARTDVTQRRNALLTLQARVVEQQRLASGVLDVVASARKQLRGSLLRRDAPPLWRVSAGLRPADLVRQITEAWARDLAELRTLLVDGDAAIANVAATFLALLVALILLRRAARSRAGDEPAFQATARVLSRPGSAAFLVLILLLPSLLPTAPRLLRLAVGLMLVVPVLRLIAPLVSEGLRRAVFVLVVWYLFDWVRNALAPAPVLSRALLFLESLATAGLFASLLRPSRLALVEVVTPFLRAMGLAIRVALALLALATVANLSGNLSLAELLTQGTLVAAYLGVVLYGSGRVLLGMWVVLLRTQPLRSSRGVQRHEPLLVQRGMRTIELFLVALWAWITLDRFEVRERVVAAAQAALAASWPLGDLELALGDLVAFGLTLYAALLLSRFVRFVLDEDLLPRASLPRGVPYAISTAANYVILVIGFLLAVSAGGFDMSRFALIVGALGVGIGIGLQDVVNNFVCGLILLFERPVQTGDVVDLGDMSGAVRRIGIRSSTVRTWDGAEVIVPNSKLVSESLINWTLSDRLRRITIQIGVAYGTDPDRVIELLAGVAKAHRDVLDTPEPMQLFVAHGDSSLDFELRAWTSRFEDWLRVRSELTVAVNRALREAGIEIPFPQRDLHLRSVDPEISDLLARDAKGP